MSSPDTEFISILGAAGSPEAPPRVSSSSLPEVLPILGLSDIVIFPGMVAPLLVETVQSTKLIDDVVAGDRLLGVVLQRNAEAENPLARRNVRGGLRGPRAEDAQVPRQHGARAGRRLVADSDQGICHDRAVPGGQIRAGQGCHRGLGRVDGHDAQRPKPVPGNHQTFPGAVRAGEDRGAQHRRPGPFHGPGRGQPESRTGRAPAVARNQLPSKNG